MLRVAHLEPSGWGLAAPMSLARWSQLNGARPGCCCPADPNDGEAGQRLTIFAPCSLLAQTQHGKKLCHPAFSTKGGLQRAQIPALASPNPASLQAMRRLAPRLQVRPPEGAMMRLFPKRNSLSPLQGCGGGREDRHWAQGSKSRSHRPETARQSRDLRRSHQSRSQRAAVWGRRLEKFVGVVTVVTAGDCWVNGP